MDAHSTLFRLRLKTVSADMQRNVRSMQSPTYSDTLVMSRSYDAWSVGGIVAIWFTFGLPVSIQSNPGTGLPQDNSETQFVSHVDAMNRSGLNCVYARMFRMPTTPGVCHVS